MFHRWFQWWTMHVADERRRMRVSDVSVYRLMKELNPMNVNVSSQGRWRKYSTAESLSHFHWSASFSNRTTFFESHNVFDCLPCCCWIHRLKALRRMTRKAHHGERWWCGPILTCFLGRLIASQTHFASDANRTHFFKFFAKCILCPTEFWEPVRTRFLCYGQYGS